MSQMKRMDAGSRLIVNGYGDGGFRIAGQHYKGTVLVHPAFCVALDVKDVEELTPQHLEQLKKEQEPTEILLIGCGSQMKLLPESLKSDLAVDGMAIDPMDSRAAARTYNILVMERRRVAAVLIALND